MFGCCSYMKALIMSCSCEVSLWVWHHMISLDSSVLQVGSMKRLFSLGSLVCVLSQPLPGTGALCFVCSLQQYPGCCSALSACLGSARMFSFHLIHLPKEEKKKRLCFTSPRKLIALSVLETPPRLQLLW